MFDTVAFKERRILTAQDHPDWDYQKIKRSESRRTNRPRLIATHQKLGIRLTGTDPGEFDKVHVPSLPAILRGHSAIELQGWQELNTAMFVLDDILAQISEPAFAKSGRIFTRADVSWNFHLPFETVVAAHRNARQPRARREAFLNRERVLELPSTGQRIIFYSKPVQLKDKLQKQGIKGYNPLGDFTRGEVQLEGKKLAQWLGSKKPVTHLDLDAAYQAFRAILCEIQMPIGSMSPGVDEDLKLTPILKLLCKLAIAESPHYGEYLQDLSLSQRKAKKVEVRKYMLKFIPLVFAWDSILPLAHPPDPAQLTSINIPELKPPYPELVSQRRREVADGAWHPTVHRS